MTITLELDPEIERGLREAAEARHLPVDQYVLSLVESSLHPNIIPARDPAKTPEDLDRWFQEMARYSDQIPNYPDRFWTRDVISDDDRG